ncbi:MAG TPA: M36 family metallopeptidase [Thermoanaerobaculia bacterium]|nr:M36 family metallopeptidase [Thermoanaerobaculia bacterium]
MRACWTFSRGLFALLVALFFLSGVPSQAASASPDLPQVGHKLRSAPVAPQHSVAGPAAAVVPAWAAFVERLPEAPAVHWNRSGAPGSLFGRLSAASPEISEERARAFLGENAALFRLSRSGAELSLASAQESLIGRTFRFVQSHRGVPVEGAEVKVSFNAKGEIVAVANTSVPDIAVSVEPALRARDALRIARAAVPPDEEEADERTSASASLTIRAGEGGAALAWEVTLSTSGPTWRVFVDAGSGELLSAPEDINRYVNTGQVFRVNAVVATHDNTLTDLKDSASAVPSSAYSIVTLQGLAGNGFLDGTYASSSETKKRAKSASNDFLFDRSNDGFSETMAYYYIDYAQRYIQSLGFNNVNNRQQVFSVNRYKGDNSFYDPGKKDITYGTGGVDDAEDADVIVHEYGHSIQDNIVPGFGSSAEAGAMGEGFGDYWAGTIGAQFSGGFQDACLAEWDATSYSSTNPPCLRRLDGTKHYPQDVVGEVHADGEIWSAALWTIQGAIGATRADRAILQMHFLIPANASFNTAANALVTAAINLGYTSAEVDAVRTVLTSRGFTVTN